MTDKKISELNAMTASDIANDDEIVISDTSATHTKKAPISELSTFFGINPEGQRDTVGAMFTAGSHSGVTVTYDDPNDKIDIVLNGSVTDAELGHLNGVTSDIQTQLDNKASLASPAFTGNATATTQTADNNSTRIATTAYVQTELTNYASDTATFTNKSGDISQWTNDSGYTTASSTNTFTNKSGNISQWTNDSNYLTPASTSNLSNKTIDGNANTISNIPYVSISNIVDTDITSVSGSDNELASSKAIKTYVDAQISGIDTLAEAGDSNISSPSAGQILVHDGTDSFDNQTSTVTLSGAVTGTANMDSSGDFAITTTIPTNTITINGQSIALGGSATIPSVLQSGGTFTGELHLNDDVLLSFGGASGSGDFSIKHESSTNKTIFAEGGTSDLEIRASDFVVKNSANDKTMINAEDGGSVELFENNTKVFETSATGVDVTGNIVVSGTVDGVDIGALNTAVGNLATVATTGAYSDLSGSPTLATVATSGAYSDLSGTPTIPTPVGGATGVDFNDDVKIRLGDGNDFEIFHDSSDNSSIIKETGANRLDIRATNLILNNATNDKTYINCIDGGTVQLFHDGANKLETYASGVQVTGNCWLNQDNGILAVGAGTDLQIKHDGTNNIIDNHAADLHIKHGSEFQAKFINDGAVELYHNNAKMFSTTSQGVQVEADKRLEIINGGTWSGEVAGKIEHHSNNMYHQFTTNFICRNASGSNVFVLDSSGNGTFNANCTAFSDIRIKEDIKTIDNALDKVSKLRGVEYTRKETKAREIGVIAQEVKEIVPELVAIQNLKSDMNPDALEDMHTMKYQNTVGLLIEAIKELKDRNEKLELIVNRLITEVEEN